jgi:dethiobiotin synthetase
MIIFVAGIDTGIGKTTATGLMARWYRAQGMSVVTQKLVQTGCVGFSEDVLLHRKLMGIGLLPEDSMGMTCPYVFKFAGSPHLAASLAGESVDVCKLADATQELARRYEVVLVEGIGGLCVPLTEELTVLDLVAGQSWPVVLVTGPRLGSINHTLLSLEAIHARRIPLVGVIYNLHVAAHPEIVRDTRLVIAGALRHMNYLAPIVDIGVVNRDQPPDVRFDGFV